MDSSARLLRLSLTWFADQFGDEAGKQLRPFVKVLVEVVHQIWLLTQGYYSGGSDCPIHMWTDTVSVSNAPLAVTFTAKDTSMLLGIGLCSVAALAVVLYVRRYTATPFLTTEPLSDMKFYRGGPTQVEGRCFDLSLARRVKGGRVEDRKKPCEQSGYNRDEEGEAQDPKNRDIVFLDQEARLSLLVRVDNVVHNLNGKVDFAVWRKTLADPSSDNSLAEKITAQAEVWGMATDGNYFMIGFFICRGLYILLRSQVVVEWFRKAPSVPVTNNNYYCNQGCNCVGFVGPVNPHPPSTTATLMHATKPLAGPKEATSLGP
ncbi:hypothetical protein CNMCM5623_005350 [Aspergillus felis]|uniref:Uncharacterized protein n=1 Tax=Aspergillus felis TaxID=1287682 RepID=A0A8H6QIH0_9EURO|nr:hypothetical protein CNMCM5623_005350 [Aspergillus felis]